MAEKSTDTYQRPAADSPTYPVTTIAKLLLISDRRVQQLSKEGVIPKTDHGRYELAPAVQGYVRYLQERSLGRPNAPEDYHTEKARLVRLQADKAEIELKELNGQLVRADDVEAEWTDMLSAMKSRLMAIPSKAAPIVAAEDNPAQVIDVIEDLVREALQELSDYANGQRDTDEGDASPTTTTEADGEPVG